MYEEELLPEWDRDPVKRAGLDARLQDMFVQHTDNDPRWADTVVNLADDLVSCDQVVAALSSVCTYVDNMAILFYGGRDEAIARFNSDLAQLRKIAAKGAES